MANSDLSKSQQVFCAKLDITSSVNKTQNSWTIEATLIDNYGKYFATDVMLNDVIYNLALDSSTFDSSICRYVVSSIDAKKTTSNLLVCDITTDESYIGSSAVYEPQIGTDTLIGRISSETGFIAIPPDSDNISPSIITLVRNSDLNIQSKKSETKLNEKLLTKLDKSGGTISGDLIVNNNLSIGMNIEASKSTMNVSNIKILNPLLKDDNDVVVKKYVDDKNADIQSEIENINVNLLNKESKITDLNTSVQSVQQDLITVKNDISTNKTNINTNKTNIDTITADVSNIKIDVNTNKNNIDILNTNLASTKVDVQTITDIVNTKANLVHKHSADDINTNATREFVTDDQIKLWTAKQDTLGFIPESTANKGAINGYAELNSNGKVPYSQLPTFSKTSIYNNIADRDKNDSKSPCSLAFVIDATDDPTVKSGWAQYIYTNEWTKIGEQESLDLILNWSAIQNKPTEFTPISHNHSADDITTSQNREFVTDNQITYWNNKQTALGFTPENVANKGVSNGYAGLDNNGKIPLSLIPDISSSETRIVNDETERLALTNMKSGDKVYEKLTGNSYIYDGTAYDILAKADWANVNLDWTNIANKPTNLSGYGIIDSYTKSEIDVKVNELNSQKTDLTNYYTKDNVYNKNEIDLKLKNVTDLTNYYTKSEVDNGLFLKANKTDLDLKASVSHTHSANDITTNTIKRFVTDDQIKAWNNKQDALGFTAENIANKNIANGYVGLDNNSKIPLNLIPDTSANKLYVVNDEAERLALTNVKSGDKIYEKSTGNSYLYDGTSYTLLNKTDWVNVNLDWTNIANKPTTLSGYGITDALSSKDISSTPVPNKLLTLNSDAKFDCSITGVASSADKLNVARSIKISGDITSNEDTFDGSKDLTFITTLSDSGVVAGTYKKVSVDSKGRVISGENSTLLDEVGTKSEEFSIGKGDAYNNIIIYANNDSVNKPFIRYNQIEKVWEFSNDGTTINKLGSQLPDSNSDDYGLITDSNATNVNYGITSDSPSGSENYGGV